MDKLLYGVAYYDEYMPYERLDEDISMMKKAGINLVRIGESTWSTFEVQDGIFNFDSLKTVIEKMGEAGINVILGTPTYAVPTWMVKAYPDILAITDKGRGLYGPRQIMDITNPTYLYYAERAIRQMMKNCVHYDNVIGVQIDNETKAYGTAGPNVHEQFKKYLREEFKEKLDENPKLWDDIPSRLKGLSEDKILDYINYEFGFDYWSNRINSWEDFPDVRGTINASFSGEFKKFQRKLTTDFLTWQAEIVREYLRQDQFITHNSDFNWIGYSYGINGETDVVDNAKALDILGTDIYHPSQDELTGMEIAFGGDVTRSVKGNYYVLETEAQGFPGWTPYDGQLRLQAYAHLANGAEMVEYWHWHSLHNSMETYWKGVLSHDFKENDVYRAVSQVGAEWQRIGDHLIHLKKNNKVAILVNQESLTAIDAFPINKDGTLKYNDVLMKIYNELYRMNIECDFIWPQMIDRLSDYKLVIIPALYCASHKIADCVEKYVSEGGHIFVTFKSFFADEHAKVWANEAPYKIAGVCGISYSHFMWPKDIGISACDNAFIHNDTGVGEKLNGSDMTLEAKVYDFMELLNLEGATPLYRYKKHNLERYAAITGNSYGKGYATYLGCNVQAELLKGLLKEAAWRAGIDLMQDVFPVICRKGINQYGNEITYYMNFSDTQTEVTVSDGGKNILTGDAVGDGDTISIPSWDLVIIEK